jgi:hypothetical protein
MRNNRIRILRVFLSLAIAGSCFQFSACSPSGIGSFISNINPCGTILACDPVEYTFLTSGYEGPGVDIDVDPFCTYPPWCNYGAPGTDPFAPNP